MIGNKLPRVGRAGLLRRGAPSREPGPRRRKIRTVGCHAPHGRAGCVTCGGGFVLCVGVSSGCARAAAESTAEPGAGRTSQSGGESRVGERAESRCGDSQTRAEHPQTRDHQRQSPHDTMCATPSPHAPCRKWQDVARYGKNTRRAAVMDYATTVYVQSQPPAPSPPHRLCGSSSLSTIVRPSGAESAGTGTGTGT
jgi:hypothetical protein